MSNTKRLLISTFHHSFKYSAHQPMSGIVAHKCFMNHHTWTKVIVGGSIERISDHEKKSGGGMKKKNTRVLNFAFCANSN